MSQNAIQHLVRNHAATQPNDVSNAFYFISIWKSLGFATKAKQYQVENTANYTSYHD
jgi:hypothetical protein